MDKNFRLFLHHLIYRRLKIHIKTKNCLCYIINLNNIQTEDFCILQKFLDGNEQIQMNKLSIGLSKKYTFCRIISKYIISNFIGKNVYEIHFNYTKYGKPYLKTHNIHFNISHSGCLAVVCINRQKIIGVDLEIMKTGINFFALAKIFSSNKEICWLFNPFSFIKFYQLWTMKEAYLKCIGRGIIAQFPDFMIQKKCYFPYRGVIHFQNQYYYLSICVRSKKRKMSI